MEQTDIALGYDGQPAKDAKGSQFTVAAELFGTNQAAWQCVALLQALATAVANIATAVNADKTELDHIQQEIASLPAPAGGTFTFTGSGTVGTPSTSSPTT